MCREHTPSCRKSCTEWFIPPINWFRLKAKLISMQKAINKQWVSNASFSLIIHKWHWQLLHCSKSSGMAKHNTRCRISTSPLSALQPRETRFLTGLSSPKSSVFHCHTQLCLHVPQKLNATHWKHGRSAIHIFIIIHSIITGLNRGEGQYIHTFFLYQSDSEHLRVIFSSSIPLQEKISSEIFGETPLGRVNTLFPNPVCLTCPSLLSKLISFSSGLITVLNCRRLHSVFP